MSGVFTKVESQPSANLEGRPVPDAELDGCCRAEHDLAALADGNLPSQDVHRLADHLARCHACRMVLAVLISNEQLVASSGLLPIRQALAARPVVDSANAL